jgi:hypothetical protein
MSPFYLAFLPALLLIDWRKVGRPYRAWLIFAVAQCVMWPFGVPGTRYLLTVFATLAILFPTAFSALRSELSRKTAVVAAFTLCGGLYFSAARALLKRNDLPFVLGFDSPETYLEAHVDGSLYRYIEKINASPPSPGPVLMIGEKRTLYLQRPAIPDFHLTNVSALYRSGGGTADGMAALLRKSGIRHIVEHTVMAGFNMQAAEAHVYKEMVARYTRVAGTDPTWSYLVWRTVRYDLPEDGRGADPHLE